MKQRKSSSFNKAWNKDGAPKKIMSTLSTKEELMEMTTTNQILLIEEIAEKVTSNPGDNVMRRLTD